MKEMFLAGEYIQRGQPVYIKDGMAYVYRVNDNAIECEHHYDEMQQTPYSREYDCSWWECICPLDLPNRKYCRDYRPIKDNKL